MSGELEDYLFDEHGEPQRERLPPELEREPEVASEAQELRALVSRLRSLPAEAWDLIDEPIQPARQRWRRWAPARLRRPALALTAAAALFGGGIVVGIAVEQTGGRGGPEVVLRPLSARAAETNATARLQNGDRLLLSFSGMPAPGRGDYYEAWLMTNTIQLVPLASFRPGPDGSARVQVTLPASVRAYRYIDISLQHLGAGTRHSRDSVLRGPTAPLF